jgi:hypothetical protein
MGKLVKDMTPEEREWAKEQARARYHQNKDWNRDRRKAYRQANKEQIAASYKAWAQSGRGKLKIKTWGLDNLEKCRAQANARNWADGRVKVNARGRAWRRAHPEAERAAAKQDYLTHCEVRKAMARKYYSENKEFCLTQAQVRRDATPGLNSSRCKKWRLANLEFARAQDRKRRPRGQPRNTPCAQK